MIGASAHVTLRETADGWELTVHGGHDVIDALRVAGLEGDVALTVSVEPNLVPGEPFAVTTLHLREDVPSAPDDTTTRGHRS
ncbi:hypothetical protein [Jatrophihabitans fulvus]